MSPAAERHEQLMEAVPGKPNATRPASPSQCRKCLRAWPCETAELETEVRRLRVRVAQLEPSS